MKYVRKQDAERAGINLDVANIHKTGSVRGMCQRYGWDVSRAVMVGGYIYQLSEQDAARARQLGILRGGK